MAQNDYLLNMLNGKTSTGGVANQGQISWAKAQLAKAPTTPTATPAQTPQAQPYQPTFSAYGGKDNYVAGQNDRWQQANASGDNDLMSRLQADSKRANYTLNPYTPPTTTQNNNASPKASSDTLLTDIRDLMNKQSAQQLPQFNYDPTNDPVYQSHLNRAKANAETASGNAMAELNKRGILNSTITGDRLGQIEQAEYGRVSDTILPELFNQAYGRHRDSVGDQYQAGRNQINDLMNVLGYTTGREDTQYNRDYQTSRDTRNDSVVDRGFDYQVGRDKVADSQWKQSFDEDKKRYGDEVAYKKARDKISDERDKRDFDEKVRLSGIDSAISWYNAKTSRQSSNNASGNANFSKLMDIWSATGKAPAGLEGYGIESGSAYKPESAKGAQNLDTIFNQLSGLYVSKDPNTDIPTVNNPGALRNAIIGMGMTDDETDKMLLKFGLQPN